MCGLNDFKYPWRISPAAWGRDLHALTEELRELTGPSTLFVLPALPIAATLAFPTPLWHVACALGSLWDDQKQRLAERLGPRAAVFVAAPPCPAAEEHGRMLCRDGVHPSAEGYALWGQHIAAAVAAQLVVRAEKRDA